MNTAQAEHAALSGAISTVQRVMEHNQRQSSADFALQALENVGAASVGFDDIEALLMRLDALTFDMSKRPGMRGMAHVEKRIADALHELTLAQAAYNCPSCSGDGCGACFGTGVTR